MTAAPRANFTGLVLLAALTLAPAPATGQQAARGGRVQVSGGAAWIGDSPVGSSSATLTENPTGGRLTYFNSTSRLEASGGWNARLSVRVFGSLSLEAGVLRTRPDLRARISGDFENAPPLTASAQTTQWIFDGGLRLDLPRLAFHRGRAVPFLMAGAGYLRQSAQDVRFEEEGHTVHLGGGLLYRLISRPPGPLQVGLRLDGAAAWLAGGLDLTDRTRGAPLLTASFYTRF